MSARAFNRRLHRRDSRDRRITATGSRSAATATFKAGLWRRTSNRCGPAATTAAGSARSSTSSIHAKTLSNNTLGQDNPAGIGDLPTPVFTAPSLNTFEVDLTAALALTRMSISMNYEPESDPSIETEDTTTAATPPPATDEAASEPAVERSRFSQWLASFGLGELQNPLLTRARPPAPRRPAT